MAAELAVAAEISGDGGFDDAPATLPSVVAAVWPIIEVAIIDVKPLDVLSPLEAVAAANSPEVAGFVVAAEIPCDGGGGDGLTMIESKLLDILGSLEAVSSVAASEMVDISTC